MNQYGWGTMMNDYTFLEGVGRSITQWGGEIAKLPNGRGHGRGRGRGRGVGRGRGGTADAGWGGRVARKAEGDANDEVDAEETIALNGLAAGRGYGMAPAQSKLEVLQTQLSLRDIRMDVLPEGMEKRRLNQSSWDLRTKTAYMTVELNLHCLKEGVGPRTREPERTEVFKILTHRNGLDVPLAQMIESHISTQETRSAKSSGGVPPPWVREMLLPKMEGLSIDDNVDSPKLLHLIVKHPARPPRRSYHTLDPSLPLGTDLKHKRFIEWPTIHVWLAEDFEGDIVGQEGERDSREDVSPPPAKRRKLNAAVGKKLLSGLVGAYASDEEGDDGGEEDLDADADGEAEGVSGLLEYGSDDDPPLLMADETWQASSGDPRKYVDEDDFDRVSWGDGEDEGEQDDLAMAALAAVSMG
ncbi:hypothetical protein FRB95_009183 [Tulasnella sp. JGI-2019a]|nr:hypothetical protein FRB95_009183 [Tulasnella sp. JGI-2019a]